MESAAPIIESRGGVPWTERCEALCRRRHGALLVALMLGAAVAALFDGGVSYENPPLLLLLNAILYQGVAVVVSARFAAIFQRQGRPGLLLLACGAAMWGVSGLLAAIVAIFPEESGGFDGNALVAIHNCCVWVAALCHLAAVLSASLSDGTLAEGRGWWLCAGYGSVALMALLIAVAVTGELLPPFFVVGAGGTMARQFVVASAVAMFALAALLLRQRLEKPEAAAAVWYERGLQLMALGMLCILAQKATGGLLGWYGRGVQYLAGMFMFVAATCAARDGAWRLHSTTLEDLAPSLRLPILSAIALVGVLFTGALHLLVLDSGMGHIDLLAFVPAVMFAIILGGGAAGLLAFMLSGALVLTFPHLNGAGVSLFQPAQLLHFGIFLLVSLGVALLVRDVQRSRAKALAARVEASHLLRHSENAQALRFAAERLESVLEGTQAGVWDLNLDTSEMDVNERWAEMIGYRREELVPITLEGWKRLVHPDDITTNLGQLRRLTSREIEVYDSECRMRHRDGRWVWVHIRGKVVQWGEDGRPRRIRGSRTDITARKLAEERLRENEQNFRNLFETISDMVVVAAPEGQLLAANRRFLDTMGLAAAELGGVRLLDLYAPLLREEAEKLIAAMLSGEREICPLPILTASGLILSVETRLWQGSWSGAPAIFGLVRDLSAEREERQRFEALFRRNPALMAITTATQHVFVDVNDTFLRTLGYQRHEVVGKTTWELGLFVDVGEVAASVEELQRNRRITDHLHRIRRKDGTILHGLFCGEVVNTQGREYFLTVMIDLSERMRIERDLLFTRQRLQTAATEKASMLSLVAHEFRTPLTLINSSLDILSRYRERLDEKEILLQERHIRSAASQLAFLVEMSRSYDWLRSDTGEAQHTDIALDRFIGKVAREMELTWGNGQEFRFDIASPVATISSDEGLLRAILGNLLANAFQFTPSGGVVRLAVVNDASSLSCTVQDSGVGIPAGDVSKVFKPFVRGSNSLGRRGMGLGLPIVRLALERLQGSIELSSEPGRGTRAVVTIPHPACGTG